MKKLLSVFLAASISIGSIWGTKVTMKMNPTSPTITVVSKTTGDTLDIGEPTSRMYNFEAPSGDYIVTAYGTDNKTVNGTIEVFVSDSLEHQFTILTNTVYATNKHEDNTTWEYGKDYTIDVDIFTREGVKQVITFGNSTTAGRKTFLALNGNSLYVTMKPSPEHEAEGYMPLYRSNTLTAGITVSGKIPLGDFYKVTVPANAQFSLGMKFTHFTPYTNVAPDTVETIGEDMVYTYKLADSQVYNYRTWRKDGLTQAGYFTMSTDPAKRPELKFTNADFEAFSPQTVNHSVSSNGGYETGDIFVNINPRGHLNLKVGETYMAHAMRSWELTDNSTNNYFIEPDFHYTVIDMEGKPSKGVIEIDNANTSTNPWSSIKAIGEGEAIVLVTYDAIGLNYYSGNTKREYMGGEYWGAIWPENTAVYVVSVGKNNSTSIIPNIFINEEYNSGALKTAGANVDAEHDIFYYLGNEEGAIFTFKPEGVVKVEIARPVIGKRMMTYNGFSTEGVNKADDGSYSVLLSEGRTIVRLTDASGNSVYQVLTAKPCHREIINETRPGSSIFQPGDRATIQYSGLRHPANKLAGIYNMSAYITYNGIPNGSSLILSANQYTFGSAPKAQAVSIDISADYDAATFPVLVMDDGAIQVNGFGDPIGNHRFIDPIGGRSPNFTAVPHKTYFGHIPAVKIPVTPRVEFKIRLYGIREGADVVVSQNGKTLEPDADGLYTGTYGDYAVVVKEKGYRCYRNIFNIPDETKPSTTCTFEIAQVPVPAGAWDGLTLTEPEKTDSVYMISTGAELAWLASHVNKDKPANVYARLVSDIDLADYDWTPIGGATVAAGFNGEFDGASHIVRGIFINNPTVNYQALFGYVNGHVHDLSAEGEVTGKQYTAGLVAMLGASGIVDRCENNVTVTALSSYSAGIVASSYPNSTISNCINNADITGLKYCAGITGNAGAFVRNCYSIGEITGDGVGACLNGSSTTIKDGQVENVFCIKEYIFTKAQTLVSMEQMESGEVAYLLGEAFGQQIGTDPYPVLGGMKVYLDENGKYTNKPTSVDLLVTDAAEAEIINIYGLDGKIRSSLEKGLNIVIFSDGTAKKIYVKNTQK